MMEDHGSRELVLYQETTNAALFEMTKGMLDANEIEYRFTQKMIGVRYKYTQYAIYLYQEDIEKLEALQQDNEFSDMPWDPDSEDGSPDPKYPWYLDKKKSGKIATIGLWIFLLLVAALLIYAIFF